MPYNNMIGRDDAEALIPEDVAKEIFDQIPAESAALSLFRQVRMTRAQQRLPVISVLPDAYWVTGDTGLKQTAEVDWTNKYLVAEELAAIVPVPEAVLDDADFDIYGEVRPRIVEAFGRKIDAAIFFGADKPASWPADIVTAATASSNVVARGTNNAAAGGYSQDISDAFATVENDGFDVTGIAGPRAVKARLRGVRTTTGELIFQPSMQADTPAAVFGEKLFYSRNGAWDPAKADLVVGDFSQALIGIRQDITYKVLDQAVLQDNTGAIVYNLAQQDMVALRVVMRVAFQVPNPPNAENAANATKYPFGVLTPA